MSTETKIKSFIRQFVAMVNGDDAAVVGEKVLRQSISAINTEISALNYKTITLEDAIEEAEETLRCARLNNGRAITSRENYIAELLLSQNLLTKAEEALETHKKTIAFYQKEVKEINKD